MYQQETYGVFVQVDPNFLDDQSDPDENRFVWAYTVVIENRSAEPVQLLEREWRITDSRNRTEIVRGAGVVGEQPVIAPGGRFEYTSGAPLQTASGFMSGAYTMARLSGERFHAVIPAFALDSPFNTMTLH
jgi:ApaG protein